MMNVERKKAPSRPDPPNAPVEKERAVESPTRDDFHEQREEDQDREAVVEAPDADPRRDP